MNTFHFLILGAISLIFIIVLKIISESRGDESSNIFNYTAKNSVMNQSEAAFFFELKRQLPEGYNIFPKMRIADMLDVPNGREYYRMRNQILPKHIDFLVCDKSFAPIVAIELNGKSHLRQDRIERDQKIEEIFEGAKIPLVIAKTGESFENLIKNMKNNFHFS